MAKRELTLPDRALVCGDTPLRLEIAAALAFPGGAMTASGLINEAARGNLVVELIANKRFTTLDEIANMRARCRQVAPVTSTPCHDAPPRPDSICESAPTAQAPGSSSTEADSSAQARLKLIGQRLTRRSPRTSRKATGLNSAEVIRNRF